jgi:hypothetical protein
MTFICSITATLAIRDFGTNGNNIDISSNHFAIFGKSEWLRIPPSDARQFYTESEVCTIAPEECHIKNSSSQSAGYLVDSKDYFGAMLLSESVMLPPTVSQAMSSSIHSHGTCPTNLSQIYLQKHISQGNINPTELWTSLLRQMYVENMTELVIFGDSVSYQFWLDSVLLTEKAGLDARIREALRPKERSCRT